MPHEELHQSITDQIASLHKGFQKVIDDHQLGDLISIEKVHFNYGPFTPAGGPRDSVCKQVQDGNGMWTTICT